MISIQEEDVNLIVSGLRSYVLCPGDISVAEGEVHKSGKNFFVIIDVTTGTLDFFIHAQEVVNDHGFAQPHELADFLKRRFAKIDVSDKWTCVKLRHIEWPTDVKKIDNAVFKINFVSQINARKQNKRVG